MERLAFIVNPIFLLMIIGSFVYVYFFILPMLRHETGKLQKQRPNLPVRLCRKLRPTAQLRLPELL